MGLDGLGARTASPGERSPPDSGWPVPSPGATELAVAVGGGTRAKHGEFTALHQASSMPVASAASLRCALEPDPARGGRGAAAPGRRTARRSGV